ncbi:MAG: hypothetical protein SR2Q5_00500 [Quinella sp. 2Q5]|nr:hypothetical protein [Quinella sp. 2Q5]
MKSARTIFFASMIFFVGSSAHAQSVPLLNYDVGNFLEMMKTGGINIWGIEYGEGNNNWHYTAHFGNNASNAIVWIADNEGIVLTIAAVCENVDKNDFYMMNAVAGGVMRLAGLNPTEAQVIYVDVFQQAKQAESQSADGGFVVKSSVWCVHAGRYVNWEFSRVGTRYIYMFNAHV